MTKTTDRTLRFLLRCAATEVSESPLESLKGALSAGWAEATPYRATVHNRKIWHERQITITEAGRAEAARRELKPL